MHHPMHVLDAPEHNCTKGNSFMCAKHTVKTLEYSCLSCPLPSLLMRNDIVQHLLKSHFVYIVISFDQSINQSINQNLYSAPSRYLLRGAPDPGQAEKNSLGKVVELRTGTVCEVP